MPTIHLLIKGKVQGVFFRVAAKEKADELGITGWVKNTTDGSVEATASGTGAQLDRFIQWCKRGSKRAEVAEVIVSKIKDAHFNYFEVIRKS